YLLQPLSLYTFTYHSYHPSIPVHHSSFFFNDTATTEIYTLSLHDALPISQRLRIRRDGGHLARGLECALPVAPALGEHPREVMLVEGSEATRSALHRVRDRVRRRVLPQVHMLVRREDQREPEGRVLLRGAPEVLDGATRVELHHAIQSLDELLVCREGRRLAGGLCPQAQA